jgi:hypothetical protein
MVGTEEFQKRIHEEACLLMLGELPLGLESDLVRMFMESFECGIMEDRIPMTPNDTVVREMSFRYGRADIVIFHADGSASVIEAKDGSKGYNHVVSGIGQSALYASQLAMTKGAISKVRKCLMWTSIGSIDADSVIEDSCISAGVVPLPWPSMRELMASLQASRNVVERIQ